MKSGRSQFAKELERSFVEERLIDQVSTFGMTTRLVWTKTPSLQEFSEIEIVQGIRNLTRQGVLEPHPLHHGRFYFALTTSAAKQKNVESTQGGPFSEREKYCAYAKLLTGIVYLPHSIPVTGRKLDALLGRDSKGLPNILMADNEKRLLFWIRIDSCPYSIPSRTAQQLRNDLFRIEKLGSMRTLIKQKQFEIVLLSCTLQRSDAILEQFRSYSRVGASPVRPVIVPELLPLLTSVKIGHHMNL